MLRKALPLSRGGTWPTGGDMGSKWRSIWSLVTEPDWVSITREGSAESQLATSVGPFPRTFLFFPGKRGSVVLAWRPEHILSGLGTQKRALYPLEL